MARRVTRVDLEANVTVFKRGMQQARSEVRETERTAERFSKRRFEAQVGADTRKARTELSALEKRLQAYARQSPEARVNLDTDEARTRLQAIQRRLSEFGREVAEARLDADDDQARAKISRIEASLLSLGRQTANPKIDIDGVARAEARLATLQAQLKAVDGDDVVARVRVDGAARASRQVSALIDFGFMLGPAFVAGAGAAAGALAGLAGSAATAAGAVGPLALAFSGVGDAVEAMDKAQLAAADNAREMARRQVMASRSIADARRGLADAERNAARSIADARRGVEDAERDAARSIADARLSLARAHEDAAWATDQAMDRIRDAEQDVVDAERDLADAHRDVNDALDDLHEARQQAIRDLQDMRERQDDNNLSIEAAKIRLMEARQELRRTSTDEKSTWLDIRKARLAVREAEDALSDARRNARRDAQELREAERDGVKGSDQVVQARERVKDAVDNLREAQQRVLEAQERAAEAEEELARVRIQNARNIADAQKALQRAMEDGSISVEEAQRVLRRAVGDGARDVSDAQRNMRRAVEDANYDLSKQATEIENLREAMSKLSPAGRQFARFLFDDLMPKLERLKKVAQEAMLPGVEAGLRQLMDEMPRFEKIVDAYAGAMGDLAKQAGNALTSPFWEDYFDFIARTARPSIRRMGTALGNFVEGFAALHEAFFPLQRDMEKGILGWSEAFKEWGKHLDSTEGFQKFLDYVERVGPKALDAVGAIADALLAIAEAAAPVGEFTLPLIEALAEAIAAIARSDAGPVLVGVAAGLATLNRTLRTYEAIKASNVVQFIAGIRRNSGRAATGLRNMGGAIRGVTGAAGLGLLVTSTQEANDELGLLESVIGGSLSGSVFGPWGAVIGGAAGALFNLATGFKDAGESAEVSRPKVESYIDTLDELTGATTRGTRAEVARRLLEEGVLDQAKKLRIPLDVLVDAVLGDEKAEERIKERLAQLQLKGAENLAPGVSKAISDVTAAINRHSEAIERDIDGEQLWAEATGFAAKNLRRLTRHIIDNKKEADQLTAAIKRQEEANVRAGKKAKLHEDQLKAVAAKLELNQRETELLIEWYDKIPPTVKTKPVFDDKDSRRKVGGFVKYIGQQWKKLDAITVSAGFFGADTNHVHHGGGHGQFAAGGLVEGPGTPTSDSIVARLSTGEFVQRASAVQREGVDRMQALNEGRATIVTFDEMSMMPRRAQGGPVGNVPAARPTLRVDTDFSDLRQAVREFVKALSMASGRWIPGVSNRRIQYSGVTLDYYTFQRLKAAEKLIGKRFDLTQGSFSTSVAASGGTHAGGGAFDADTPFTREAVVALRKYGVAAWRRYPGQGPWGTHIHGVALGDRIASPQAKQQMRDYLHGGDGLGGRDYEPRPNVLLPIPGFGGRIGRSVSAAKHYALSQFGRYHWNPDRQWSSLNRLWIRESNWRWNAENPDSGAYGIPQALPPSKMARFGPDWRTNPKTQIDWGLWYIHNRYGTPVRAWAHSQATGWYDKGGTLPPGVTMAINRTGANEEVLTPVERKAFAELGKWAHMSKYQAQVGAKNTGFGGGGGTIKGSIQITNWQKGIGFFQGVAEKVATGQTNHAGQIARMYNP